MGCPPAVALDGDADLVVVVSKLLVADGYEGAGPACPAERASVARVGERVVVAIADTDGRRVLRTVDDVATAATLIESFATETTTTAVPPVVAVAVADSEEPTHRVVGRAEPALRTVYGVDGETAFAADRSLWIGARASACMRVGRWCVGAATRFMHDTEVAGAAESAEVSRMGIDLLVGGQLRVDRGRWTVAPSAYVGLGWLRTTPEDMTLEEHDTGGVRGEVGLAATLHVTDAVGIRIGAVVDATPFAHGATRDVPAEPSSMIRIAVGIEVR